MWRPSIWSFGVIQFVLWVGLVCLAAPRAIAHDAEVVRSDLPFWSEEDKTVWPRRVGDMAFGTIFATGDWEQTDLSCAWSGLKENCTSWWRLRLASVFHGTVALSLSSERKDLDHATRGGSTLFAELRVDAAPRIYAIQTGFLGGSGYMFVTAPPGGLVKQMTLLDVRCGDAGVHAVVRKARFETVYLTRYCAVKDVQGLRLMGLAALNRPPLATVEWVEEAPRDDE